MSYEEEDDEPSLREENAQLRQENAALKEENEWLRTEFEKLKRVKTKKNVKRSENKHLNNGYEVGESDIKIEPVETTIINS